MASLQGKTLVITGGGSGFGKETCLRAAQRGGNVVVCDINGKAAEVTTSEIKSAGGKALSITSDVTKKADWDRITEEAVKTFGQIDVLINNAGWSYTNKKTATVTEEEFDRVFLINVKSIFLSSQTVVPQMVKQGKGGSVVNISSVSAMRPRPGLTWYSASKGAVSVATKALATDYAGDNIRFNTISPVLTATGLFSAFTGMEDTEENQKKFLANIPLGRLGSPGDVANAALFYAADDSKFLTGTDLPVDGGRQI